MTNPVFLTNIKLNLTKKAYEYTAVLSCCGVELLTTDNNTKSISIAANVDKLVTYNNPAQPINAQLVAGSCDLKWKMIMNKKGVNDPKPYDKPLSIPVKAAVTAYTVLLGKVGNITFSASVSDQAELKRQEDQKRQEAERKRQEEERQRQEDERLRLEREAAEAQRREQQRLRFEEIDKAAKVEVMKLDERWKTILAEMDYSESHIMSAKAYFMKLMEEDHDMIVYRIVNGPRRFPSLNPELRIAKLFQDPLIEDDPVFQAICAKPQVVPPATSSRPEDIYTQSTIAPDAHFSRNNIYNQHRTASTSPSRVGNYRQPSPQQPSKRSNIVNMMTPLDLLHQKNSDADELAKNDPARRRFGATAFEEDFGDIYNNNNRNNDFDDVDPAYLPPEKLYRMGANPLGTLRQDHSTADLPPLESLPKIKRNELMNTSTMSSNNQPQSSPRKGVTFSDQPQQQNSDFFDPTSKSSSVGGGVEPIYTSPQQKWGKKNDNNNNKGKDDRENVRFEMDLEPPPALMTALLHLSRDGGNLSATIPIEHQQSFLSNGDSISPARGFGINNNSMSPNSATRRLNTNGSPGRSATGSPVHGANRENSMTPRRRLPLVYTNIGEVVSKTRRHDDRAVPSFMRTKEIRLQGAGDPAQSYWNCFAPQKAQNLVGVRMPATAVSAFEEAASIQVAAASPPRRVTGAVPNAPRNLRTSVPPKNSLRTVDSGESSAHRAGRRW